MVEIEFKVYRESIKIMATEEQAEALYRIAERSMFDAYFWASKVYWFNNDNKTEYGSQVIRANNHHYVIGDENQVSGFRGFSGHKFKFRMNNGEIIESTNVWHQGQIPEELKDILVDNAELI